MSSRIHIVLFAGIIIWIELRYL